MKYVILIIIFYQVTYSEYSIEDFRKAGKRKYSSYNTKVDLLFNAYDEDDNSSSNKITLRVGLYDSDKKDRRSQNIETFVNECIEFQENIKLAKAKIRFLEEQEEYYIGSSEEDKKEALVFERAINSNYIEKLFSIRERIFQESYELKLAEEKLKAKME